MPNTHVLSCFLCVKQEQKPPMTGNRLDITHLWYLWWFEGWLINDDYCFTMFFSHLVVLFVSCDQKKTTGPGPSSSTHAMVSEDFPTDFPTRVETIGGVRFVIGLPPTQIIPFFSWDFPVHLNKPSSHKGLPPWRAGKPHGIWGFRHPEVKNGTCCPEWIIRENRVQVYWVLLRFITNVELHPQDGYSMGH